MAAKVTFNEITKIITVTQAPDVDGEIFIDVKIDLYSDGKEDWVANENLRKFLFPIEAVGGRDLPGSKALGTTYFLDPAWKIRPYEASHRVVVNGNLYSADGSDIFLDTLGTYTVRIMQQVSSLVDSTVQQLEEIEFASFQNAIWVDVLSSHTGTDYPVGTRVAPVNNLIDAKAIADFRGFKKFFIVGDITFTTGDDIDHFTIEGESPIKSTIVIETAASTVGCSFKECTISGILDGNSVLEHCEINSLDYVNGEIRDSRLAGPITLGGGVNSIFLNCGSINPGVPPIIDMGGAGQSCIFHDYSGGVKFQNMTGADSIRVQLDGGKVILLPTVSAGAVTVVGIGLLEDSIGTPILSGAWNGTTVLNALVNVDTVAGATWEQTQKLKYRIESLRNGHVAFGSTFYWNPGTGDDLNDGSTYALAVKTFTRAHDLVASEHGDVIIIVGGTDFIVDEHIIVTKNDVHVRGQGPGTQVKVASGVAINISGNHCSAEAIKLDGGDIGVILTGDGFSGTDLTVVNTVGNGVEITSVGSKLENVYCSGCGGNGVEVKNGTIGFRIKECGIRSNANGVNINAGVVGVVLAGATDVSSNSNYGVNINPGAIGSIIYDGAIVHNNTVGDINDNGIATVIRSTDESIADTVWDELISEHQLTGSTGKFLTDVLDATEIRRANINDLGASKTKFTTTLTEDVSGFWTRAALLFTTGQNDGLVRGIKNYNGGTKEIQIQTPLSYAPADGDEFIILPARKFLTPDTLELADDVWNHATAVSLVADVAFVKDIEGGRWEIDGSQMIFYKDDNTTEIARFNIFKEDGTTPATKPEDMYERKRVQ